jgi:hypothetical protein
VRLLIRELHRGRITSWWVFRTRHHASPRPRHRWSTSTELAAPTEQLREIREINRCWMASRITECLRSSPGIFPGCPPIADSGRVRFAAVQNAIGAPNP